MLDISRIQAGKLAFAEEAVDVDELVRELVEQQQHTTARHHINIEGTALGRIVGDKQRLEQVLINLLTNAMKYSPHSEKIIVRLTHTHDTLTVSVQDFGIGISKALQEKVFERFYRVYSGKDKTYPGKTCWRMIQKVQRSRATAWHLSNTPTTLPRLLLRSQE